MAEHSNSVLKRFKVFINRHPKLIRKIRKNGKSWQEIYEQWVLLGEDDIHWEQYKEEQDESGEEKKQTTSKLDLKPDFVKQILKYTETVDVNKLQDQVQQLSKTIATVQEIVNLYQKPQSKGNKTGQPFDWFRD